MATFSELQARVRGNIIDLPDYVRGRVPDVINSVIRDLQMASHNWWIQQKLLEATTDVDATPGDLLVAMPSDFKEWAGKPWEQPEEGKNRKLELYATRRQVEAVWEYGDTGAPKALFLGDPTNDTGSRNIYVRPFPDGASDYSDGEYRIKIPYVRILTALSADADTNWFTVQGERFIEYEATAACFFLDHDEERGAMWTQRAASEKQMLLRLDKRMWMSHTPTLSISFNAY